LSFQRFFRCFRKLSGMTGTAREAAGELWQTYGLPTVAIPPNRPCLRKQHPDQFFPDEESKWSAVVAEIEKYHATGRPILVGTRNVLNSERLGRMLEDRGLPAKILNASRLKEEAEIVALAGEAGRITIATNMAGRGTDIKLGRGVAELGGLHVIATERHESGRVDRQLAGRAGRQGDPGSVQMFASAEDELLRKFLRQPMRNGMVKLWRRRLPGHQRMPRYLVKLAQKKAQSLAYKQRQGVVRADAWMDQALSFTGADTI
jgi:preprotein translocase subunit SecA